MTRVLVIVPCGSLKIWDKQPSAGATRAADSYIGPLFNKNKAYAERFADDWLILSAKYGLISPGFLIPGPYNVTFKKRATRPIAIGEVVRQAQGIDARKYDAVVGLGGIDYCTVTRAAFSSSRLEFPFLGLRQGPMMSAIKRALETGQMFPPR
jgi:hypothetical protein